MTKLEAREILRYFILSSYRDGEYILQDEYEELEIIIKRNDIVKELEELRYLSIMKKISEDEYNKVFENYCKKAIKKIKG